MKHSVLNRLLALGLALALCLSLAACSSSSDTEEEEVTNTVQAQAGGSVTLPEGFTVPEEAPLPLPITTPRAILRRTALSP